MSRKPANNCAQESLTPAHVSLSKSLFDKLSNANRGGLGSRLKRLHPAARIICALLAHKFHTCRALCVLSDAAAFRKSAGGTFLA